LSAATTYSYTVAARDAAGNISANSTSVSITLADTTVPTTPTGLTAAAAGSTGVNLSWSASTDKRRGDWLYRAPQWRPGRDPRHDEFSDTGLSAATTYSYAVAARDAAGNISPDSASVSVTTGSTADTTRPRRPPASWRQRPVRPEFNLSWSASTDNRRSDRLYRAPQWRPGRDARHDQLCGYGFVPATTYSYTVAARDAAGNISADSTSVSITLADTTTPTTPAVSRRQRPFDRKSTCPGVHRPTTSE